MPKYQFNGTSFILEEPENTPKFTKEPEQSGARKSQTVKKQQGDGDFGMTKSQILALADSIRQNKPQVTLNRTYLNELIKKYGDNVQDDETYEAILYLNMEMNNLDANTARATLSAAQNAVDNSVAYKMLYAIAYTWDDQDILEAVTPQNVEWLMTLYNLTESGTAGVQIITIAMRIGLLGYAKVAKNAQKVTLAAKKAAALRKESKAVAKTVADIDASERSAINKAFAKIGKKYSPARLWRRFCVAKDAAAKFKGVGKFAYLSKSAVALKTMSWVGLLTDALFVGSVLMDANNERWLPSDEQLRTYIDALAFAAKRSTREAIYKVDPELATKLPIPSRSTKATEPGLFQKFLNLFGSNSESVSVAESELPTDATIDATANVAFQRVKAAWNGYAIKKRENKKVDQFSDPAYYN